MKKICLLLFLFIGFLCSAQMYKRIDFSSINGEMYIANKLVKSNIQDWRLDITHLKDSPGYAKINNEELFEIKGLIGDISFVLGQVTIGEHKLFDISYDLIDIHGLHHYSCLANILDGEISFHSLSVSLGDCIIQSNYQLESNYLKLCIDFKNLKEKDIFKIDNIIIQNHLNVIDSNIPDTTTIIKSVISDKYLKLKLKKHQNVLSFRVEDVEGGTDKLPTLIKSLKIYNALPRCSDFKQVISGIQLYQDGSLIDVSKVLIEKDSIQIFFDGKGLVVKNDSSSLVEIYSDVNKLLEHGLKYNLSFMLTSQSFVLSDKSSLMKIDQKLYSPIYSLQSPIAAEKSIISTDFNVIPKGMSIKDKDWIIDSSEYYDGRYNYFLRANSLDMSVNSFTIQLDTIVFNKCDFSWSFRISNDNWSPSSSNKFCYYLFADSLDFRVNCNAYALGVNMESSDDVLCLYRVDNGVFTRIAETSFHWAENQSVNMRVLRTYTGDWSLSYSKNMQNIMFEETIEVNDSEYKVGLSSGLLFNYTVTRAKKLFIDNLDLSIMEKRESFINKFYLGADDQLCIEFSERVDLFSISSKDSYVLTVDNFPKEIYNIRIVDKHIELDFPLSNGHFIFSFKNVKDINGKDIEIEELCFDYFFTPKVGEIVINEILCDPNDSQKEFLELYNTTDKDLYLNLVNFKYNDKIKYVFNDYVLTAHAYLLFCSISGEEYLKKFGYCCPVSGFSLAKTSGILSLTDSEGNVINELEYSQKWYDGMSTKGYSLEKINSLDGNDQSNWSRCKYGDGCTPGMLNSVDDDNTYAHLINLRIEDERHILLEFDKALDVESVENINIYHLTPSDVCYIRDAKCIEKKNIELEFDTDFPQEFSLNLEIIGLLDIDGFTVDCTRDIYIPKLIEAKELLINEICYVDNGSRIPFIELYNNSENPIDLSNVYISDGVSNMEVISKKLRMLEPKSYIAISEDANELYAKFANIIGYPNTIENFISCKISNLLRTDNISILDYNEREIDSFDYRKTGIVIIHLASLERISFNDETNDSSNWTLGSSRSSWRTPGYANDLRELNKISGLKVENATFRSRIGNGKESLVLHFYYPDTKFKLRIDVYDMRGMSVNILKESAYHENSFDFLWDGHFSDGKFANGIMNCVVTVTTSDGKIIEESKSIIAA